MKPTWLTLKADYVAKLQFCIRKRLLPRVQLDLKVLLCNNSICVAQQRNCIYKGHFGDQIREQLFIFSWSYLAFFECFTVYTLKFEQ